MKKLDFNPNMKPTMNVWATYIPTRSTKPKFSTHRLLTHAKSAIGQSLGIIYEYVDGEWVERWRRDEYDTKICAGCSVPHKYRTVRDQGGYRRSQEVPGGKYLHGSWARDKSLRYEYWCGINNRCVIETVECPSPKCDHCGT